MADRAMLAIHPVLGAVGPAFDGPGGDGDPFRVQPQLLRHAGHVRRAEKLLHRLPNRLAAACDTLAGS